MEVLAVPAGPLLPARDGAFVEAEGGDDGLHGAAVAEQSGHGGDRLRRGLQAVEGRAASRGEGLVAGGAAVATLFSTMDADVALTDESPCGAVGVVAELGLRVHRVLSPDAVWLPRLEGCPVGSPVSSPYPPDHA